MWKNFGGLTFYGLAQLHGRPHTRRTPAKFQRNFFSCPVVAFMPSSSTKRSKRKPWKKFRKFPGKGKNKHIFKVAKKAAVSVLNRRSETKYFDTYLQAGVDQSSSRWSLSAVTQGDTETSRVGDEIFAKSLRLKLVTTLGNSGSFNAYNTIRYVLFRYIGVASSAPIISDVFDVDFPTTGNNTPYNFTKHKDGARGSVIKVLLDVTHMVDSNSQKHMETNHLIRLNHKITFATGQIYGNNHIYLMAVSDSGVVPYPQATFMARLQYTDS